MSPASFNLGDVRGCCPTTVLATVDQVGGGRLSPSLGVLVGGEESPEVVTGRIFLDVKEGMLANGRWDTVDDCTHLEGI